MVKLTEAQLQFWNDNSYLVIPKLFASQMQQISEWVNEVAHWPKNDSKWINSYEMDNPELLSRVENFTPFHDGLKKALTNPIIIDLISALMGEPAILYKERINFKYPGGGPHGAHQDGVAYEQWEQSQFNPGSIPFISMMISVDTATSKNGCLEIAPNWEIDNLDILPMESPFEDKPHYSKICKEVEDGLSWEKIPTNPGDTVLFTERVPHRSAANYSNQTRRVIYGVFNPESEGDKRESYYEEKRKNPNSSRYMVGNPHAVHF